MEPSFFLLRSSLFLRESVRTVRPRLAAFFSILLPTLVTSGGNHRYASE